jgi:UDP-glucose 4-epimerase
VAEDAKRVLAITGSSGYIGTQLLARLERAGDFQRVIGLDVREPQGLDSDWFEFHHCDVREGAQVRRIFEEAGIDTVVHLAYILDPTRDPDFEYDVDVNGTRSVLAACRALDVTKLVIASSDTAYGSHEDTPDYLKEDAPLRGTPGFPYSENKAKVEALVSEFAEQVPDCTVVILRPCIVMGPKADNVLGRTLLQPILFSVRGYDPIMQLIHEEDMAEAFYLALVRDVQGAYNVACDAGMRYSQVAGVMDKPMVALPVWLVYPLVELLFRLRLLGFGRSQLDYIRYPLSIDPDKIMKEMGFAPRYTSRQALEVFRDSH